MADITAVPYNDIIQYLHLNNQHIPANPAVAYQLAENLIYTGKAQQAPESIVDFIIAKDLQLQGNKLSTNINELRKELAIYLKLDDTRINRVLKYLGYQPTSMDETNLTGIYDIDREIIFQLDPSSILNLCQISKRISPICNDQNIFRQLIKLYYPNSKTTSNPKQQFTALVNNMKTDYILLYDRFGEDIVFDTYGNRINLLNPINPNDIYLFDPNEFYENAILFSIPGIKPENGDKYWLLVDKMTSDAFVFLTLDDAINGFLDDDYDEILDGILNHYYQTTPNININENVENIFSSANFQQFLIDEHYPRDLHRNGLFKYIKENKFFNTQPNWQDVDIEGSVDIYQFIPISINNRYQ